MTSIGIEEEFLLVGRRLMLPVTPTNHETNILQGITAHGGVASREWLSCQVEHASGVFENVGTATSALLTFRRKLASVAGQFDMIAAALGTAPSIGEPNAAVSEEARYLQLTELAPAIAADQYINGMHVHVSVPDPETGVQALNGIRPWLPLLTALGANSPFWRGRDSGFASWRGIHYRRWMVNGVPPPFHDFTDYQTRVEALLATDVVAEHAGICWLARLSRSHPTIEVRACDVQLQTPEAVVLAALIRALVCAAIDRPPRQQPEAELLDVAHWQAAKYGLDARLLDPFTGAPRPAEVVVWQALNHAWPYLKEFGDADRVHSGLKLLLTHGNGATRQRAVFQQAGIDGVLRYAGWTVDELEREPAHIAPQYDSLRTPAKLGLG
ncbi:carboxylate-amine ligase [Nesterenkonia natronophila]|uniref:Putative glutamate--cysteine ligase 2 n=1 Tax=Nesterenkonia natronophila TaxID=2174932 RepID=A0A3A4FKD6_9MICC|nr:YbdK family carboxylate-amine ligase [Nesterenkonia natronophila]RJN32865.1 YbdK family carboxylate-amine ligase [Nesterenkonia natronophila]